MANEKRIDPNALKANIFWQAEKHNTDYLSVDMVVDAIDNAPAVATDNNVGDKWIPVTERLPEVAIIHKSRWEQSTESVHVLCACKQKSGKRMVKEGSCKVYASGTIYWMIPGTVDSVTHWMPLPQPPKEG